MRHVGYVQLEGIRARLLDPPGERSPVARADTVDARENGRVAALGLGFLDQVEVVFRTLLPCGPAHESLGFRVGLEVDALLLRSEFREDLLLEKGLEDNGPGPGFHRLLHSLGRSREAGGGYDDGVCQLQSHEISGQVCHIVSFRLCARFNYTSFFRVRGVVSGDMEGAQR